MAAKTYAGVRTQTSLGVTLLPTNKIKPLKAFEWRRASLTEGTTRAKAPRLEQIRHVLRIARRPTFQRAVLQVA